MTSARAARWSAFLAIATVSVMAFAVNASEQQSSGDPKKTQWERVYSVTQAQRGEELFASACVSCHSVERGAARSRANLPLNHPDFWANWNGLTLEVLSQRIRLSMPAAAPGTLTRDQVADIIAYLLELEGAQAGSSDLPSASAELRAIRLVEPVPPAILR